MLTFISGLVCGGLIVYLFTKIFVKSDTDKNTRNKETKESPDFITQQQEEKAQNMEKLKGFIASWDDKITNDQVQALLKVSTATAERYLNDLEKEGILKQVGDTGASVFYEKI